MFYNQKTEENMNYLLGLRNQINKILLVTYNIHDEIDREDCVSHTIEQLIVMKKNYAKEALSDSTIKKAIKFAYFSYLRKNIKTWKVIKLEDWSYDNIKTVDIEGDEEDWNWIENIWVEEEKLSLEVTIDLLKLEMDDITKKVFYYMSLEYKEQDISEILNIKLNKVKYLKKKVKEIVKNNKERFIN